MVNLKLLVVGKTKYKWLDEGIRHYLKLMRKHLELNIIIVKDEKITSSKSSELILDKEAERIFKYFDKNSFRIVLDSAGKNIPSESLAQLFSDKMNEGYSDFTFIIGGALGLSQKVVKSCHLKLSLSSMTFTHQLSRLVLLEQVYRAFSIIKGEKYHK